MFPRWTKQGSSQQEFVTFGNVYPLEMQGMEEKLSKQLQKNARISVANVLTASSLVRETGIPAIVDPFSARMTLDQGGVVIRPLQQDLRYHMAIITRGVDTMTQETRQLAEALITGFQADPIIIAAAN